MPVDFVPLHFVKQYVPRCSMWRHVGVIVVVSAVKYQSQHRSCGRSLVPKLCFRSWYCLRVAAAWISLLSRCELHASTGTCVCYGCVDGWTVGAYVYLSTVAGLAVFVGLGVSVDFAPTSPANQHVPRCSGRGIAVGADYGWIPRGALLSCTPSTGPCGCYGCVDGWTEGARVHVSTVAGLARSFYTCTCRASRRVALRGLAPRSLE